MLNFGKVSVTKGLGEWIALHKRMAPKMSEAGMFFRFVAADPNEETLFLVDAFMKITIFWLFIRLLTQQMAAEMLSCTCLLKKMEC